MSGSRVPEARLATIKTKSRCLAPCTRCVRRMARGEVAVEYDCAFSHVELHTVAFVDLEGNTFNKCGYCLTKSNADCVHVSLALTGSSWPWLAQFVLIRVQLPDSVRDRVGPLNDSLEQWDRGRQGPDEEKLRQAVVAEAQNLLDWVDE